MKYGLIAIMLLLLVGCGSEDADFDSGISERPPVDAQEADDFAEPPPEPVAPVFRIDISGAETLAFDESAGDYAYDYEEPADQEAGAEDAAAVGGYFTMSFMHDDQAVTVRFEDHVTEGTYVAGIPRQDADLDGSELETIAAAVMLDDTLYGNLTDGRLVLDDFGGAAISGSFMFTLENDADQAVVVEGTFDPVPFETVPSEALDDPIGGPEVDSDRP